ncbi:MAG: hypothetical protein WA463_15150 [Terriglobales bacterium]
MATKLATTAPSGAPPRVTSYDSGYEFSLEHWLEVRQLVEAEAPPEAMRVLAKAS